MTALAVPVVLSAAGLAVVGPGVLPAVADDPPRPRIKITQVVDPTTYDKAGQVLTWTSLVTNFGNTTLQGLEVTDSVSGLPDRRCTPVAVGGTLAAGASTTCTAAYAVTQADLDGDHATTDVVTASATTAGQTAAVKASASATASATGTGSPGLTLTATTSPTSVTRPGQTVAYTFVARNRGNQTLRELLVTAPFPDLSALVCSPVAQGGTLAPEATTTCRATRTIAVAELATDPLKETAKVEATTVTGTRVANSGTASVAVKALPPAVPDETVGAVAGGPVVALRGARDARPGGAGGPAIDPSRTVFVDADQTAPFDGKQKRGLYASWTIFPDGSVRVQQLLDGSQSGDDSVDYRVYDVAGHSSVGHLTVQIHQGATPGPFFGVAIKQNQPITVDVLGRDHAGQNADGTRSSFDRTSLRLISVDLGERYWDYPPVNYGGDEQSISIVGFGDYTATTDGRITFTPAAGYGGTPPPVRYSATSRGGSTVTNVLVPTVQRVRPVAGAQATTVAYGRTAVLAVAAGAKAGHPSAPIVAGSVVLTSATATEGGKTLVTYRGTWRVQADGSVRFSPADGFVGRTEPVEYTIADRNGTLATSTLTATVRPGPKAVLDRTTTAKGSSVSLTPLGNDVPGVEADRSAGAFVTATLAFPTAGQPAGAAVTSSGHTLDVPGEGVWTAGSGIVTFAPAAGFAGGATPVSYTASDDLGKVETGRITVAVTSGTPAATDDEAATTFATSVKLPAATDDSPGSSPLVPASTVFPSTGQPASATVSLGGKKLTVPGQGFWAMAADGSVTFVPDPAYAGTTTPAAYQVVDGSGQTATATLVVTVRPGPAGNPDAISVHGPQVVLPLTQNDVPGRNADATVGTIDNATVRFALTGQPQGWVISEDGHSAALPPMNGFQRSVYIDGNNVVTAYAPTDFSGVFGPLVYTAQDRVLDAAGVARRHSYTSSLTVTFAATDVLPTATDDHAVTTDQIPARLAARSNDLGGSYGLQYEGLTFPADQLGGLPVGSKVDGDRLVVAGEGTYSLDGRDVSVEFVPVAGFASDGPRDTTPVEYQIKDFIGRTARGTLTVRVLPGAVARPDTATTPQNVPVNVDVVANDDPGPSLTRVPIPRSLYGGQGFAAGEPKGSTYSSRTGLLTVPGQGVYGINRDGTVAFDPDSQFRGVASPVVISESFEADRPFVGPFMVTTTSTLRVTVVGTDPPVASPDTASARVGTPVVVKALANDVSAPSAPLVGSTVRLRLADGLPTGSTLSGDAKRLTVAGRGVFLAAGNGEITFVPLGARTGAVPTIGYQVADANGTTSRSTITVRTES